MRFNKLGEVWNRMPLIEKIIAIVVLFVLLGLSTRSLLLAVIAWVIIIFYIVKTLFDYEVL